MHTFFLAHEARRICTHTYARMICIGDNIISPLGDTTEENLQAILYGHSGLRFYEHAWPSIAPICASLFTERPSFVELCITSASRAIKQADIDASSESVIFVFSTTKGDHLDLWTPAVAIAKHFCNENQPIVVSNACISGVCAQIVADRLLHSGRYETAVVIGCDVQSQFIVSGFQSFKALSDEPCRPFADDRKGLNLGEAVGTMVMTIHQTNEANWTMQAGAIHNDANHISGPSRTGEGSYRCLMDVQGEPIDFVSVHGTATPYNDAMEAIALQRAGLDDKPIKVLKPHYGHTLGAAGVIETIISLHTSAHGFIKMLSGFGGCNAAVRWGKRESLCSYSLPTRQESSMNIVDHIDREGSIEDIIATYKSEIGGYAKFYKMDALSRVGFVMSELILRDHREEDMTQWNVVIANRTASLANDRLYQATIQDPGNYYPSPALFVYTLPNIVTGEIAIRNKMYGETMFYIMQDAVQWEKQKKDLLPKGKTLCGWIETDGTQYKASLQIIEKL